MNFDVQATPESSKMRYLPLPSGGGVSLCVVLCLLHLLILTPLVHSQTTPDPNPGGSGGPAPPTGTGGDSGEDQLLKHFKALYNFYMKNKDSLESDCNVNGGGGGSMKKKTVFDGWGTLQTLKFLGEISNNTEDKLHDALDPAEYHPFMKTENLKKFREYLARIGYLKDPGSLVILGRQQTTLRLLGCPEGAGWHQQGESTTDDKFQDAVWTGDSLKTHAPNIFNYVAKFTCFKMDKKCTHTFYVITQPLAELPLGYTLREHTNMEEIGDEYAFSCNVPYCRIRDCKIKGSEDNIPRRSYPPYTISWRLPKKLRSKLKLKPKGNTTEEAKGNEGSTESGREGNEGTTREGDDNDDDDIEDSEDDYKTLLTRDMAKKEGHEWVYRNEEFKLKVVWSNKVKKERDLLPEEEDSYEDLDSSKDLKNSFFDSEHAKKEENSFHSRIVILDSSNDVHAGSYECIIQDANGLMTTPFDLVPNREYRGKANIHVLPYWQIWVPIVIALACVLVVVLIIVICPKKMEHDDGTPYTKDELVAPTASEFRPAPGEELVPPEETDSKSTKK